MEHIKTHRLKDSQSCKGECFLTVQVVDLGDLHFGMWLCNMP